MRSGKPRADWILNELKSTQEHFLGPLTSGSGAPIDRKQWARWRLEGVKNTHHHKQLVGRLMYFGYSVESATALVENVAGLGGGLTDEDYMAIIKTRKPRPVQRSGDVAVAFQATPSYPPNGDLRIEAIHRGIQVIQRVQALQANALHPYTTPGDLAEVVELLEFLNQMLSPDSATALTGEERADKKQSLLWRCGKLLGLSSAAGLVGAPVGRVTTSLVPTSLFPVASFLFPALGGILQVADWFGEVRLTASHLKTELARRRELLGRLIEEGAIAEGDSVSILEALQSVTARLDLTIGWCKEG